MRFLIRVLIAALGLWLASELIDGVRVADNSTLIIAALLLGLANAIVRPVLVVLTLPITILTLGLFLLVVNGAMVWLVSRLLSGFVVQDFSSAVLAALVVAATGWVASLVTGKR
jgi:putative membrane protein